MSFIKCHDLEGNLDGSVSTPPIVVLQLTPKKDGKVAEILVHNSEYITWKKRDQFPITYITTTLLKEVLYTISKDMCVKDL